MTTKRQKHSDSFKRLYDIAEAQQGYFTAKQAESAGFDKKNHHYHVRSGNWIREHRGIYRLAQFPHTDHPDMIAWSLWSRNREEKPQGVYSHQTALSIYELSDLMPAKLHMTVPPHFRRSGGKPKVLVLHRGSLHKDDVESMQGFQVTRPLKTIADLVVENSVSQDHLRQAVREAFRRGLISRSRIEKDSRIAPDVKKKIEILGKGA